MSGSRQPTPVPEISHQLALPEPFYARSVMAVARELLGCILATCRETSLTAGRIIEVEAYGGPEDLDSHSAFRRTGLVRAMWGPPGRAYVYRAYGVYPCFNTVTAETGTASAVLIRALEPVVGVETMLQRLGTQGARRIASGPGKLSLALGIGTADNCARLDGPGLWLQADSPVSDDSIVVGPRIGVRRGDGRHWRFAIRGHPDLSRPFPDG